MCQTCDKLRAEIRELREEIAEWERSGAAPDGEEDREAILSKRLKLWPQPTKLICKLMDHRNRTVSKEQLTEELGYNGMGRDHGSYGTDESRWLAVVVFKARRALESVGIFDAIHAVKSEGYIMTKTKAAEISKYLED